MPTFPAGARKKSHAKRPFSAQYRGLNPLGPKSYSLNPSQRTITAAQGYSELDMLQEAIEELNSLPPEDLIRADVIEMRVLIFMKGRLWKEALIESEKLCAIAPEVAIGFIHAAFCLHELGCTREARELLLEGPASLVKDPTYHYNLACYECVLGNLAIARAYLDTSLTLDAKLIDHAKTDPDLKPLQL